MATPREHVQSILAAMTTVVSASDELLEIEGVADILKEMDDLAWELKETLD